MNYINIVSHTTNRSFDAFLVILQQRPVTFVPI